MWGFKGTDSWSSRPEVFARENEDFVVLFCFVLLPEAWHQITKGKDLKK